MPIRGPLGLSLTPVSCCPKSDLGRAPPAGHPGHDTQAYPESWS